jgi:hypothetical protein
MQEVDQGCTNPGCQVAMTTKFSVQWLLKFVVLHMDLASYHPSGDYNFDMVPIILENLCTPKMSDIVHNPSAQISIFWE